MAKTKHHEKTDVANDLFHRLGAAVRFTHDFRSDALLEAVKTDFPKVGQTFLEYSQAHGVDTPMDYFFGVPAWENPNTSWKWIKDLDLPLAQIILNKKEASSTQTLCHLAGAFVSCSTNEDFAAVAADSSHAAAILAACLSAYQLNHPHISFTPRNFQDPQLGERLHRLFDRADQDVLVNTLAKVMTAHYKPAATGGPYDDQIKVWWEQASQIRAKLDAAAPKSSTPGPGIPIPEGGALSSFLQARADFTARIAQESPPINGAWLNRPAVWEVVRSIDMQNEFFRLCRQFGAFKKEVPAKPAPATPSTPVGLISALDEPATVVPSGAPINEARAALVGYLSGIESKTDFLAVLNQFSSEEMVSMREILEKKADGLRFYLPEILHAYTGLASHYPDSTHTVREKLALLSSPACTPKSLSALLTATPGAEGISARALVEVVSIVHTRQPDFIDRLDGPALGRLCLKIGSTDILGYANKHQAPFVQSLLQNISRVVEDDVASGLLSSLLRSSASAELAVALAKTMPVQRVAEVLDPLLRHDTIQSTCLSALVENMEVFPSPGKVLSYLTNRGRISGSDINVIGKFLGHTPPGTPNAYAAPEVLSALSNEEKIKLLTRLSQFSSDSQISHRHPISAPTHVDHIRQAIAINASFDLVDSITPPPPVTITRRHKIAHCGFARPGESLSWDGALALLAPHLDKARPVIPWDESTLAADNAAEAKPAPKNSSLLDRKAVVARLNSEIPSHPHPMEHGGCPPHLLQAGDFRGPAPRGFGLHPAFHMHMMMGLMPYGPTQDPSRHLLASMIASDIREGLFEVEPKQENENKSSSPKV